MPDIFVSHPGTIAAASPKSSMEKNGFSVTNDTVNAATSRVSGGGD